MLPFTVFQNILKMKFSQRLVLMLVAGCLCLIYIFLSYTDSLPHVFATHQDNLERFLDNNPISASLSGGTLDQSECRSEVRDSKGVISTLELMNKTDYNIYINGQYNLPHPPVNSAAYSPDLSELTVIIVPHSHVDPGWLETVDEYYNGKVKHILDNMVRKLHLYRDMTFIWAEMVFFTKWWDEQTNMIKNRTLELIRSGRLEIVSGAWVMVDEASTHYVSVIDQLLEGHQWVVENLGVNPENSWSIDPFGHSGSMPYLWKKASMKNMVIQRIHQATKAALAVEKNLEFSWKQYWDDTGTGDILCHIMPYTLYSLHQTCGPDKFVCAMFDYRKIQGDPMFQFVREINKENVAKQSRILYEQYRLKASLYKYNTILVPLGDDFRYNHAEEWDQQYENYNKLMRYMNSRKDWKINIRFGTLKDYFKSIRKVHTKQRKDWPMVSGDFFPYSDHDSAYWTGYFTTRPFDKRFSREVESRLRAADIFHTLAHTYSATWGKPYGDFNKNSRKLQEARRNLALFLHHDAITGTGRQYVVQDYENKLDKAFQNTAYVLQASAQFLLTNGRLPGAPILEPELIRDDPRVSSLHQRISPNKDGVRLVLINPTAQHRSEFVEVITNSVDFEITNANQDVLPYQINPVFSSVSVVNPSTFEVVFLTEIPALGIEAYIFTTVTGKTKLKNFWTKITIYNTDELIVPPELKFDQERPRRRGNKNPDIYIENDQIGAQFRQYNGMLTKVIDKTSGSETVVDINFKAYTSRGSGAYIFLPDGPARDMGLGEPKVRVIEGPFMSEVHVVFQNLLHKVRLYNHPGIQGRNIYIQNALDMNIINMRDREPIMRVQTNIKNKMGHFFSDENGFQMIGRKPNPSDVSRKNIERNYYPITTMALIEDKKKRVTLHTGQPHGVASLEKGWLEVMLDRQLIYDDERGLSEGVTDNKLTMTKFVLQIEEIGVINNRSVMYDTNVKANNNYNDKYTYPSLQSIVQNEFLQQPLQKLFTPINTDIMALKFHPMKKPLPCDTTIVSLRTLAKSDLTYNGTSLILHRKGYSCGFSSTPLHCPGTDINIKQLLPGVDSRDVTETSLTHLVRNVVSVDITRLRVPPMEIKTFLIHQNLEKTITG